MELLKLQLNEICQAVAEKKEEDRAKNIQLKRASKIDPSNQTKLNFDNRLSSSPLRARSGQASEKLRKKLGKVIDKQLANQGPSQKIKLERQRALPSTTPWSKDDAVREAGDHEASQAPRETGE